MPAYNSSHYVEESISSVLNQTHRNIELIVIDDGSTDETWTIINAWSERDDRIIAMRQKNQGVSAARNNAISKSTGDFIAFCDSDDVWYANKLERQLDTIGDAVWSHCDSQYVGLGYEDKTVYRSTYSHLYDENIFAHLAVENFITTSSLSTCPKSGFTVMLSSRPLPKDQNRSRPAWYSAESCKLSYELTA